MQIRPQRRTHQKHHSSRWNLNSKKVNKELKNNKLNEFASGCDKAGQKMESFGKKMSVVSAGIAQ